MSEFAYVTILESLAPEGGFYVGLTDDLSARQGSAFKSPNQANEPRDREPPIRFYHECFAYRLRFVFPSA